MRNQILFIISPNIVFLNGEGTCPDCFVCGKIRREFKTVTHRCPSEERKRGNHQSLG